jgi:hypothetical protein
VKSVRREVRPPRAVQGECPAELIEARGKSNLDTRHWSPNDANRVVVAELQSSHAAGLSEAIELSGWGSKSDPEKVLHIFIQS